MSSVTLKTAFQSLIFVLLLYSSRRKEIDSPASQMSIDWLGVSIMIFDDEV